MAKHISDLSPEELDVLSSSFDGAFDKSFEIVEGLCQNCAVYTLFAALILEIRDRFEDMPDDQIEGLLLMAYGNSFRQSEGKGEQERVRIKVKV